jgi:hypothetical protein
MMIDNAFPVQLGSGDNAIGFLQEYVKAKRGYSQQSTDPRIPTYGIQEGMAQELGGPLFQETLISGSPSFDLSVPDIPALGPETPEPMRRQQFEMLMPGHLERRKRGGKYNKIFPFTPL